MPNNKRAAWFLPFRKQEHVKPKRAQKEHETREAGPVSEILTARIFAEGDSKLLICQKSFGVSVIYFFKRILIVNFDLYGIGVDLIAGPALSPVSSRGTGTAVNQRKKSWLAVVAKRDGNITKAEEAR